MTPTFKMHGSKARTAPWLVSHFPSRIGRFIEPFAGRGNVYFRVATTYPDLPCALLGDTQTAAFLLALRDYAGDYAFVDPGPIDTDVWQRWKDAPPSVERVLAESYVARFGSHYSMGPNTAGGDSLNGHSRDNTIRRMKEARRLLQHVEVVPYDWAETLDLYPHREGDVLYLDPPYDVPQTVHFDNIDHNALIKAAKARPGYVFVSGYSTPRYEDAFAGWNRDVRERASTGKGAASLGASGNKPRVEEVLWWKGP